MASIERQVALSLLLWRDPVTLPLLLGGVCMAVGVWLHVSERDNRYTDREETWHNWVLANERMAAALKAKGYKYQYVYSQDSGHTDRAVIAHTLPEALEWLWK